MLYRKRALSVAVAVALGASAYGTAAYAQDQQVEKLEKIQVTGSRISRVDVEGPAPVTIITSEEIKSNGFTDVFDAINALNQNSGGVLNQQDSFSFTPAAKAVNLRGQGVGRTLILLDGRRLPQYPVGSGGTTNFIDLGQIPIAAVERIEVLTDGASAVYGSDAIGGVVNVILKKDIDGAIISARYGDRTSGGYQNGRVSFVAGGTTGKLTSSFVGQFESNDLLKQSEVDWAGDDGSSRSAFAGYSSYGANFNYTDGDTNKSLTPAGGCESVVGADGVARSDGKCGFNRAARRTLRPENTSFDLMANFSFELNEDVEVFSQFRTGSTSTYAEFEPIPFDYKTNRTINGTSFEGEYTRRLVELGNRVSDKSTDRYGFMVGSRGVFNDYDWEAAWSYSKQTLDASEPEIYVAQLEELIENGTWDPLTTMSESVINQVKATRTKNAKSSVSGFSSSFSGDLFEMAGGTAGFAVYAEYNQIAYSDRPDEGSINGLYSSGSSHGGGKRDQLGLAAEVLLPITEQIEISSALRYDNYDDASNTGSAVTPKVAATFRPNDQLLLRSSYGKSFRAPDLQRLYGGDTKGFNTITDLVYCQAQGGSSIGDESTPAIKEACSRQYIDVVVSSNDQLEEETGSNIGLGAVFQASEDLTFTVDWYSIDLKDIVDTPELQKVVNNPSSYAGASVVRNSNQQVESVTYGPLNLASSKTQGISFKVNYAQPFAAGDLDVEFSLNRLLKSESQIAADEPVEDKLDFEPRNQAQLKLGYTVGKVNANVFMKYRDSYCSAYADNFYFATCAAAKNSGYNPVIASQTTFNVSGAYQINDAAKVSVGIVNLFDRIPPADGIHPTAPYYDDTVDDATGRQFYIEASYQL